MAIQFPCSQCSAPMTAPEAAAGKRGKCSRCGTLNRVPSPLPTVEPVQVETVVERVQQSCRYQYANHWDEVAGMVMLPAFLCSVFAACFVPAALLGMALSAASLVAVWKTSSLITQIGGGLLCFVLMCWCGFVLFMEANGEAAKLIRQQQAIEAMQQP